MNSLLSPEAYRQLLDVSRDEDGEDDEGTRLFATPESSQQYFQQQQHLHLLSFVDWDVLDGASAVRMLDQYARLSAAGGRTGLSATRKRLLRKPRPRSPASLLPLPVQSSMVPDRLRVPAMDFQFVQSVSESRKEYDTDADHYNLNSPQRDQAISPSKPYRAPRSPTKASIASQLPPLDVQVVQRKRVFLDPSDAATIGIEEIVQLQERMSPPKPGLSPLQLTTIPKRCSLEDEVALMPCHSLQYRFVPSLAGEIWREPIRDRHKHWVNDELNVVLALARASEGGSKMKYAMSNPHRQMKGKWHHWEAMKLHINDYEHSDIITKTQAHSGQGSPAQILIRNQGAMISKTYCVVSVFGVGIYGRLYSSGLAERHGDTRFLRFHAYDPKTSSTFSLIVTFKDLEWVFHERPQFLVAGKKHAIIKELIALLYFKYPDDQNEDGDEGGREVAAYLDPGMETLSDPRSIGGKFSEPEVSEPQVSLPILCISPDEKLNAATKRRHEREERLRLEKEERLRALALFMELPKRARYRLLCQVLRVNGHRLIVSIYHYSAQTRNFVVLAYHPPSSRTFPLAVGVMEAASLSRIFTLPHKWSQELKLQIAKSLLPMLRLNGAKKTTRKPGSTSGASTASTSTTPPTSSRSPNGSDDYADYRMGLGIREDCSGLSSDWLPPPAVQTPELLKTELVKKYQIDGQRSLKIDFDTQMRALEDANTAKTLELEAQTKNAEARKADSLARDSELKEKIEEINSGKGVVLPAKDPQETTTPTTESSKGSRHELRRELKAARAKIKDDLKVLGDQMVGWKREIQKTREHGKLELEKAWRKLEKAVQTLENEALVNTRGILDIDSGESTVQRCKHGTPGQKTWLARAHIDPSLKFIASGACHIEGQRHRCSVFDVLDRDEPIADSIEPTTSKVNLTRQNLRMLQILLYNPSTSQTRRLDLAMLDWIAYTKKYHEVQLLIPQFEISTSPVTERVKFLDASIATCRQSLPTLSKKKKPTKKILKKRAELVLEMQNCLLERKKLFTAAPWHRMIAALGERLSFSYPSNEDNGHNGTDVLVDRCIFRAILPIVSSAGEEESQSRGGSSQKGDSSVIYCHVRVVQELHGITFEVFDPTAGVEYALVYPDSAELVKEFAVETFMEQQMHLEAIAMSLLFFINEATGKMDIRFED